MPKFSSVCRTLDSGCVARIKVLQLIWIIMLQLMCIRRVECLTLLASVLF